MKRFKLIIHAGDCFPIGYGLAYKSWSQDAGVFYPIPFNWIIRWARSGWYRLVRPTKDNWLEQECRRCYLKGRADGYAKRRFEEIEERSNERT